ncbi:MAG: hypothetical protein P8N52_07480 [Crocinitomicaceae bacterium]|nr:hypothetical protein [Crocinitomicaceae bacterium]MDG1777487.1 hypothetical protein [Crocinitomicaceae bacterium]
MLLVGVSLYDILIGILYTSIILLVIVIAYRRLLNYFGREAIRHEDYCQLESLEISPATGELPFYFTSPVERSYRLLILDGDMNEFMEVVAQDCKVGGNIVRFDSSKLPNGDYFYCLKTDNQKVSKKMTVLN